MAIGGINPYDLEHIIAHDYVFVDDFIGLDTTHWTTIEADTGATVTEDADGSGGVVLLTTGATDNNEVYIHTNEIIQMTDKKPCIITARISYTEANTDDANVLFGMMTDVAADHLVNDSGGPLADYDGACFFKVDGGTAWQVESSAATTQTTHTTTNTAGGGYQTLRIEWEPFSSTQAYVRFLIDTAGGNSFTECKDTNSGSVVDQRIKHTVTMDTDDFMAVVLGAKAGSANSEVISVDWVTIHGRR